ncbi:hypothetical protein SteCoe_8025 [Stentor coeruleus]|uniref:EF-hand domain-containing protein n=1 Tax=Stentor coeruleus TaxID=5963 RepID=A0A1R2CL63_9CILI|nr:hypothetical protein SteCoe_8025 [Stentor coeruleus]
MESKSTEEVLADFLTSLSLGEKEAEKLRYKLVKNTNFDPHSIFESLDTLKINKLSYNDLYEFLQRNTIYCTKKEVFNLITYYDKQSNGYLEYNDFLNLIIPATIPNIIDLLNHKSKLTTEIINDFCNIIECELILHRNLQEYKIILLKTVEPNLSKVFSMISEGKDIICKKKLKNFLMFIRPKVYFEVDDIFRRLCRNKEGISYEDLIRMCEIKDIFIDGRRKSVGIYDQSIGEVKETLKDLIGEMNRRKGTPVKIQNELNSSRGGSENCESAVKTDSNFEANINKQYKTKCALNNTGKNAWGLNSTQIPVSQLIRHTRRASESCLEAIAKAEGMHIKSKFSPSTSIDIEKKNILTSPQVTTKVLNNPNFSHPLRKPHPKGHNHTNSSDILNNYDIKPSSLQMTIINPNIKSLPSSYDYLNPQVISKPFPKSNTKSAYVPNSAKAFCKTFQYKKPEVVEENELVKFFTNECLIAKEGEILKCDLAMQEDFNIIDAFRIFDKIGADFISIRDIQDYLERKNVFFKFDDIFLLFRRYTKNKEMKLKFSEFSEMLIPRNERIFSVLKDRIPRFTTGENFSGQTLGKFITLLEFLIKSEISAEKNRVAFKQHKKFNFSTAFAILDKKNRGYIEEYDFEHIFSTFNIKADLLEIKNIFQKFKSRSSDIITIQDFIDEFTPKSLHSSSTSILKIA